ncbi:glycosyltransferase [Variovorax sp. KBS0712]|uniref:glycosyltransferase n=1 Tax=Variovorax sp. KBS0712 TaxID=2578111 RepID=UPI00163DE57F|nr:glycosyltransferase [Variovorax sp. KBS0712]
MDHPVCLSNPDRLLSADASIEHVPFAMWLVSAVRPQRLVELGTRGGNVYLASCQTVASLELSTQCFAMAIFDPDTRTDASGIAALRQHHDPLYGHFSALIPTTPADASQSFDLGSIDILHIDASHPLIRLEDQIRHWHPKMSRSGLIIVRGIESADLGNEDRHAWALLRTKFCCFQFHHDSGLGVLLVGSEPPEVLNAFWDSRDEDSKALKLTFSALGSRLSEKLRTTDLRLALAQSVLEHQKIRERLLVSTSIEEQLSHKLGASHERNRHWELELRNRDAVVSQLEEDVRALNRDIAQNKSHLNELLSTISRQTTELSTIHESVGWAFVQRYWRLRARWFPLGTRRGLLYEKHRDLFMHVDAKPRHRPTRHASTKLQGSTNRLGAPNSSFPWQHGLTTVSRESRGQRILIVAELSLPACKRYRVDQKLAMFNIVGYEASAIDWRDHARCMRAMQFHGLVIFYRVPASTETVKLAEEARRLLVPTFFDVDDLVFEVDEYRENLEALGLPSEMREAALDGARQYREMLRLCLHGIASTPTIARHMKGHVAGEVHILENGLDDQILRIAERAAPSSEATSIDVVTIGYGSGSRTHDADFIVAADALARVMQRHANVRLVVHGPLKVPPSLAQHADRIFSVPFLEADDYLLALSSWHISIAPLENTTFNHAKSNIKFIEAAAFRIPSICSATGPFSAVITHGLNGMLARNSEEWEQALTLLITDRPLRHRMGNEAYRSAMSRYRPTAMAAGPLQPILDHLRPSPKPQGLKVLIANVLFSPHSFGGATIVAEQLARQLAADGCGISVFTGITASHLPNYQVVRYEALGLPVIAVQLPNNGDPTLEYNDPAMKEIFVQAIRAVKPNVVHLHSIQMLSSSLIEACAQENIPYAITLHDAWWLCERQFMVREDGRYCGQKTVDLGTCSKCVADSGHAFKRSFHLRKSLEGAALLLAPSEFQRQLYIANGLAPHRVVVNKNGVLLPDRPRPARAPNARVRFAYLGGRAAHKGYFWLKDLFESLPEDGYVLKIPDIAMQMGPPSIQASEWNVNGQIEVLPPYKQTEMDDFFDTVDVLLVPSQAKESFGLSVREALARGIWVIATASGGVVEDIVDGVNGRIVGSNDQNAFRDAVLQALSDPDKHGAPSHTVTRGIRDYRAQAVELKQLLERVVTAHRGGTSGVELPNQRTVSVLYPRSFKPSASPQNAGEAPRSACVDVEDIESQNSQMRIA